jgi:LacI family transcriptional regulator
VTDPAAVEQPAEAPRRPRLRDIAASTGLSIKTVSRAVRGERGVGDETRALVLAEAERLGFQPDDVAAGLRRKNQTTNTVGVTLGDVTNPFFAPMIRGIHGVAAEHQHLVLSADAENDAGLERRVIRSLLAHRVAGLIIAPIGQDLRYLEQEASFGTPIVFVDSPPPGLEGQMDAVVTTNTESTREGIAMLLARGHRRIGYLGHPRSGSGALERWRGYEQALADAGVAVDPALVRTGLVTEDDATLAARDLLAQPDPPTAVFTDNNRLCVGLLLVERVVQSDLDILSFDDVPLAGLFGVSVIDSDPHEVGRVGATLLFERLVDRERPAQRVVVPARLRVRERVRF